MARQRLAPLSAAPCASLARSTCRPLLIMRFTALLPPPPTPITWRASSVRQQCMLGCWAVRARADQCRFAWSLTRAANDVGAHLDPRVTTCIGGRQSVLVLTMPLVECVPYLPCLLTASHLSGRSRCRCWHMTRRRAACACTLAQQNAAAGTQAAPARTAPTLGAHAPSSQSLASQRMLGAAVTRALRTACTHHQRAAAVLNELTGGCRIELVQNA